jgi:hypothetical protein
MRAESEAKLDTNPPDVIPIGKEMPRKRRIVLEIFVSERFGKSRSADGKSRAAIDVEGVERQ